LPNRHPGDSDKNAVPTDPTALTDDLIWQKIAQVLPAAVAQTFIGMWPGTLPFLATAQPVTQANSVPAGILPQANRNPARL